MTPRLERTEDYNIIHCVLETNNNLTIDRNVIPYMNCTGFTFFQMQMLLATIYH